MEYRKACTYTEQHKISRISIKAPNMIREHDTRLGAVEQILVSDQTATVILYEKKTQPLSISSETESVRKKAFRTTFTGNIQHLSKPRYEISLGTLWTKGCTFQDLCANSLRFYVSWNNGCTKHFAGQLRRKHHLAEYQT
jgi:hypothetical protein